MNNKNLKIDASFILLVQAVQTVNSFLRSIVINFVIFLT